MRNLALANFDRLRRFRRRLRLAAQTYDPKYPVCLQIYQGYTDYYFECAYTSLAQVQNVGVGPRRTVRHQPVLRGCVAGATRQAATPRRLRSPFKEHVSVRKRYVMRPLALAVLAPGDVVQRLFPFDFTISE